MRNKVRKTYTGSGSCSSASLCGFSSIRGSSASSHGLFCKFSGSGVSILLGDETGVHTGVFTDSGFERRKVSQCF